MAKQIRSVLDFLSAATAEDLAELDKQIASKQAELDALRDKMERELKPLTELRKLLELKVHGPKPRKTREPRAKKAAGETSGETIRDRVYTLLAKRGPMKPAMIIHELDVSDASVYQALKHEWFRKGDDGYEIATA